MFKFTRSLKILVPNGKIADPLRQKSEGISEITDELRELARQMIHTMEKRKGLGLAAPQVGHNIRLIIVSIQDKNKSETPTVMVNPQITYCSDQEDFKEEGCLSLPGIFGKVARATEVEVIYQDLDNQEIKKKYTDLNARIVQHEVDHLEGTLFTDKVIGEIERLEM